MTRLNWRAAPRTSHSECSGRPIIVKSDAVYLRKTGEANDSDVDSGVRKNYSLVWPHDVIGWISRLDLEQNVLR